MPSSEDFIAAAITALPEISQAIQKGLKNGDYARAGGAILTTDGSQTLVALLHDILGEGSVDESLALGLGMLATSGSVLPLLALSISVISFGALSLELETIEHKIDALTREVKEVNWKLDSKLYADFHAGLNAAEDALKEKQQDNRRASARQAIDRFRSVESQYLDLLEKDLNTTGGQWAATFLNLLVLAVVSETLCRLELGELERAQSRLDENRRKLTSPCERFFELVIGQNPAIFLHPDLADQVTLERMTQLWRRRDPALTASMIFERLRSQLWEAAGQGPRHWVGASPRCVREPAVEGARGFLTGLTSQGGEVLKRALGAPRAAVTRKELPDLGEEQWRAVVPKLAEAFAQLEWTYETLGRLRGFESELAFLAAHDISFAEWQRLTFPESRPGSYGLILPLDSELLPQTTATREPLLRWPGGSPPAI